MSRVKVIETNDYKKFENEVEQYLGMGFELKSCNCGFVNSEQYDFASFYHAILVRE